MTARPTVYAAGGMVATPHYLASQVGARVLQEGGNAVDAAIAANAALNVTLPHQCHVGGDLFAMVWDPDEQKLHGLNASGPAPAGASIDQIAARGYRQMPERGELTVTVPGTVAGWDALAQRFGSRELAMLLAPAAAYARDGFPVSAKFANYLGMMRILVERDETARALFVRDGGWRPGDRMTQPALAETFERIGREGRDGFYCGPVAADIVQTLQRGGSAITEEDLATFEPEWVEPVSVSYRGVDLYELPANTQGPMALLLARIAEGWPVREMGHISGVTVHAGAEAVRRAFVERNTYLSDPRYVHIEADRFTDEPYVSAHRDAIDLSAPASAGAIGQMEDGDTAYLCAVDRDGLAISLIQSVYMGFGSGVVAPRSGVLFHNRGYSFSLDPDHINALEGGKRPRHTLIPAMLFRDGLPWTVFGTMGADGQAQTHLQLLMGLVDFELDPQAAIETPRWVVITESSGDATLVIEPRAGRQTINELRDRGHNLEIGLEWDPRMGHAQMIQIDRERGVLAGAADPRGDGMAIGF